MLPLSHDEVVHGKYSLIGKMPGDEWQRSANLRLLLGYQYAQAGKKLLFMGCEIGQEREWNHDGSLQWDLLEEPLHAGIQRWTRDLNHLYRDVPAMHELDCDPGGFEWIDANDSENSVAVFMRSGRSERDVVVCVFNFTPMPRRNYLVGVPFAGMWREALNSDAADYGGSGQGNLGGAEALPYSVHGRSHCLNLTLPPLGCLFLRPESVS
jgi:1,4-alpha-glucan branching enzyme